MNDSRLGTFSRLWPLLILPVVAMAAAVIILLSVDDSDSDRLTEIGSVPSPAPVTFIPPTPLPTIPPTQETILGQPVPDLTLITLAGYQVQLRDYQGQIVFLNFWATWCVPCQEEMPALQAFQDEHDNVSIISVTDPALEQTEDDIRSFVEAYGLTLTVALSSDLAAINQFSVIQLPVTFMIDPQGIVRYRHVGALTEDDMDHYLSHLTG